MKHIYIVGIGGAGTSALARLYVARGYHVSGSDDGDGFYSQSLRAEGIEVFESFLPEHVPKHLSFAVYSTAFRIKENAELMVLSARGVPLYTYAEALGAMTREFYTIAVCGTHGKTTTTALCAHALSGAGNDPSALVGSRVTGWHGGARIGHGQTFVIEADEYQNKLAHYQPQSVLLTNIDFDHPDFFADFDAYKEVFSAFVKRIPRHGYLVACHDDADVMVVARQAVCNVVTYGEHPEADACIISRKEDGYGQRITLRYRDTEYMITTHLLGRHNAQNVVGAWVMSVLISKDIAGSTKGIADFKGVMRRLERKGVYRGAVMIDDYAHHPEEIRATLTTLRDNYPRRRIVVAFHPHTFSRTVALLRDFAQTLALADVVLVLDIYASAREVQGDVCSEDLVDAINALGSNKAQHVPTIDVLARWATAHLTQDDVFVTLGAGDVWTVHNKIMS